MAKYTYILIYKTLHTFKMPCLRVRHYKGSNIKMTNIIKVCFTFTWNYWNFKCNGKFILTFAVTKVRYDDITTAKLFAKNLLFLVVYQRCNNALSIILVKTSIKYTLNKVSNLQIFIKFYLKTLPNFIICSRTEIWTSLVENCRSFCAVKLLHICVCATVPDE